MNALIRFTVTRGAEAKGVRVREAVFENAWSTFSQWRTRDKLIPSSKVCFRHAALTFTLALACCAPPRPAPSAAPPGAVVAFVGVTVLPLVTAEMLPDQTVIVRG